MNSELPAFIQVGKTHNHRSRGDKLPVHETLSSLFGPDSSPKCQANQEANAYHFLC